MPLNRLETVRCNPSPTPTPSAPVNSAKVVRSIPTMVSESTTDKVTRVALMSNVKLLAACFLHRRFGADLSAGREDAQMETTVQSAALLRHPIRPLPAAAALVALGIVYGDIGTSPLYAFKQAAQAGGTASPDTILGVASLILWTLIVIISVKYAILIMRADNHGEGGIMALLALLDVRRATHGSWRASLLILGLMGAALLYGDGVITPAISVLSAVEGLKVDAPGLAPVVVPLSIIILVCLFLVQRKGTSFIGNIFGPLMLLWFFVIGVLGIRDHRGAGNPRGGQPPP